MHSFPKKKFYLKKMSVHPLGRILSYVVDPIYYVICAIRRNDLDPEDWPIERHETDRSGRELVLLMTKEEIASPPGSDAHRNYQSFSYP